MKSRKNEKSQIWCRNVEENKGNLYFWIRNEETEDEWIFYTSVKPEDSCIYYYEDNSLFVPQTALDEVKLELMAKQYQDFYKEWMRRKWLG